MSLIFKNVSLHPSARDTAPLAGITLSGCRVDDGRGANVTLARAGGAATARSDETDDSNVTPQHAN